MSLVIQVIQGLLRGKGKGAPAPGGQDQPASAPDKADEKQPGTEDGKESDEQAGAGRGRPRKDAAADQA